MPPFPKMLLQLKFESRRLSWLLGGLVAIELVIVAIYVATALAGSPSQVGVLFNLDEEANVPAWFSSMQLFSIGLVMLLAAGSPLRGRDGQRGLVTLLGCGFVFLSMDEAAGFHEKVTTVMSRVSWAPRFSGGHGIWMFVYVVLAAAAVAALYRPIVRLVRSYPRDVLGVAAGLGILGLGAVGVEAIGYEFLGDNPTIGLKTLQVAAEEFLEMLGGSVILVSTVRFAAREVPAMPSEMEASAFPQHSVASEVERDVPSR